MTYIADVDPAYGEWLTQLDGITHLGDGRVQLTDDAVAFLRNPPSEVGLFVSIEGDDLFLDFHMYKLKRVR